MNTMEIRRGHWRILFSVAIGRKLILFSWPLLPILCFCHVSRPYSALRNTSEYLDSMYFLCINMRLHLSLPGLSLVNKPTIVLFLFSSSSICWYAWWMCLFRFFCFFPSTHGIPDGVILLWTHFFSAILFSSPSGDLGDHKCLGES